MTASREHSSVNRGHAPGLEEWTPGEGWRQVELDEWYAASEPTIALEKGVYDKAARYWVRVPPVPPLPTVPYTVIRVTWEHGDEHHVYMRGPDNWWVSGAANRPPVRPDDLSKRITGFEVLSEPRAVTAKAVLDRVRNEVRTTQEQYERLDVIAREFKVVES